MTDGTPDSGFCYVYGIVAADAEPPAEVTGIGEQPVGLVRHGRVGGVVSDLDSAGAVGKKSQLLAHSRVLDAVAAETAVIPLRFGTVLQSRSALVEDILAPDEQRWAELLEGLTGRSQFVVQARYDVDQVLAEVVAENPRIADLRSRTRGRPETETYHARVQLGELVAAALEAKRETDAPRLLATLLPHGVDRTVRHGRGGIDHLLDVAFLVDDEQRGAFEGAAEELARSLAGRARVKLVGPTAPYDFVAAEG
jgi:Gas vesicle synthesis protein GvpL/GvpF